MGLPDSGSYDDFYTATKAEAQELIVTAKELTGLIASYCTQRMKE